MWESAVLRRLQTVLQDPRALFMALFRPWSQIGSL